MASQYPTALDQIPNPSGSQLQGSGTRHSALHAAVADAVEAVQATLGVNPQGTATTVRARLDALTAAIDALDGGTTGGGLDLRPIVQNADLSYPARTTRAGVAADVSLFWIGKTTSPPANGGTGMGVNDIHIGTP